MSTGIYSIGTSALNAARTGLATVGHNISNAGTAGYHRQEVIQASNSPVRYGAGFIGQGVRAQSIERSYDQFLAAQLSDAQTRAAQTEKHLNLIAQLDNLVADESSGIAPAIQGFFSGMQDLATNPSSMAARSAFLGNAQSMINRFRALDQQVNDLDQASLGQIRESISTINAIAKQVARLNQDISNLQGNVDAAAPNDLLDKRAQLISELNKQVKTTSFVQDNGTVGVFIGNGQPLVLGNDAFALSLAPSSISSDQVDIGFSAASGFVRLGQQALSGGELAGLLSFRDGALKDTRNAIGRLAVTMADAINRQHQMGQDLNGQLGRALFEVRAPVVSSGASNTGNAVFSAAFSDTTQLKPSNYHISFDGANYRVTRELDGAETLFSAFPQTIDGVQISLSSGSMAAGDQFLLQPVRGGAAGLKLAISQGAEIAAATPIRTAQPNSNSGTAKINAGRVESVLPLNGNLTAAVTITFTSSGAFNVTGTGTGNPTNVIYASGSDISFNGWTVKITGVPQPGDTFTVGPNTLGVSDNRNALAIGDLQTAAILDGGQTTFAQTYQEHVGAIGIQTSELRTFSETQAAVLGQAKLANEAVVGVNLDEEAAKLMRYQEAYKAAAKVMQIANEMFDTVLSIR
jgi:flagellar hook-associated protein 1